MHLLIVALLLLPQGQLQRAPALREAAPIDWGPSASAAGPGGHAAPPPDAAVEVDLEAEVALDAHGAVISAQLRPVSLSELPPRVAEPILASLRRWRFTPAAVDGQAVSARTTLAFTVAIPAALLPAASLPEQLISERAISEQARTDEPAGPASSSPAEAVAGDAVPSAAVSGAAVSGAPVPATAASEPVSAPAAPGSAAPGSAGGDEVTSSDGIPSDGIPATTEPGSAHADIYEPGVEVDGETGLSAVPGHSTFVLDRAPRSHTHAAADHFIEVGALRAVPRRKAAELLQLAPGVLLTNHGGEGHPDDMFVRGFDAGTGKDLEVLVEGIPVNEVSHAHGHGNVDTSMLPPELISHVRILEGPFDASQGDFAVAGTAEYLLGAPRPGLFTRISYGSFQNVRGIAIWGDRDGETFAGASASRGDGFGPNRAHQGANAFAQLRWRAGEVKFKALGLAGANDFASAGIVRADDVEQGQLPCGPDADAQFFCPGAPLLGGGGQRLLGKVEASHASNWGRARQLLFAARRTSVARENFTGYTLDGDVPGEERGDLIELATAGTTVGLSGDLRTPRDASGAVFELGYRYRHDSVEASGHRLRDQTGIPYATDFAHAVEADSLGAYSSAHLPLGAGLFLDAGLRGEWFLTQVEATDRPTEDRSGSRLPFQRTRAVGGALLPRVVLSATPITGLRLSSALGVSARSSDGAALSDGEPAPFALVGGGELGARYDLPWEGTPFRLSLQGSAYYTHVAHDFVFIAEAGRNEATGPSRRMGLAGRIRAGVGERLDVNLSAAWAEGFFLDPAAPPYTLIHKERVPFVPRLMARTDAVWHEDFTLFDEDLEADFSLGSTAVAPRPLPEQREGAPIFLVDTALSVRWRSYEVRFTVENLLDARWRQAELFHASDFDLDGFRSRLPALHFAAGAPRRFGIALSTSFGGPG